MNIDGDSLFFLRLGPNNPVKPLSTVHVLNVYSVCDFWYIWNNFVLLGCGHTYY
jgi:hypothetical protein